MSKIMSLRSRKELLASIKIPYQLANKEERIKILDGLVAATGYRRKHADLLGFLGPISHRNSSPNSYYIIDQIRSKFDRCLVT